MLKISGSDAISAPFEVTIDKLNTVKVKIDQFYISDGICIISGWASEEATIAISDLNGSCLQMESEAVFRPDVNEALGYPEDRVLGFSCFCICDNRSDILLLLKGTKAQFALALILSVANAQSILRGDMRGLLGQGLDNKLARIRAPRENGLKLQSRIVVDEAIQFPINNEIKIVIFYGWCLLPTGSQIWLEDAESGFAAPISYYTFCRPDIIDLIGTCGNGDQNGYGFIAIAAAVPNSADCLYLSIHRDSFSIKICEINPETKLSFMSFIKAVFNVQIPDTSLAEYYSKILKPVIYPLHEKYISNLKRLPYYIGMAGEVAKAPKISVIVPLYGRDSIKLFSNQLMCFSEIDDFRNNIELIYVVDDPRLLNDLKITAEQMYDIYGIPFKWIYKNANLGFALANNLGADFSSASYMVFMNSDVFPISHNWIEKFLEVHDNYPDVGLVGARLRHPDGALQHDKVRYCKRQDLGVWTHIHPGEGSDPAPSVRIQEAKIVTGACVGISREIFNRVGGWSEDYIIGDFEDSDLCLKIAQAGLRIVSHSAIEFVHLERQSFYELGDERYKYRLAIYNAVTHQEKWLNQIENQDRVFKGYADGL